MNFNGTFILSDIHQEEQEILFREGTSQSSPDVSSLTPYRVIAVIMPERSICSPLHRPCSRRQCFTPVSIRRYRRDLGGSPPSTPRNVVGRDESIERAASFVNAGVPIALIDPGDIGKPSIGLALLNDGQIKEKFEPNRRFVRCDKVQSYGHFFNRVSNFEGHRRKGRKHSKYDDPPSISTVYPPSPHPE